MPDSTLTLTLDLDDVGISLPIHRMTGREAISQLYDFELHAAVTEAIDARALVGQDATLRFLRDDAEERTVSGILAEVEESFDFSETHYVFRLVPRFFRSSLIETCDVFMDLTLPQLIERVLQRAGLSQGPDFGFKLVEPHAAREFVVQYKETDLAFVSRLCEHVGVSFFFEEGSEGDRIVFSDGNAVFPKLGEPIRFDPRGKSSEIFSLALRASATPERYVMRDYNYRTPLADLTAQASLSSAHGGGVVEYGAHFKTVDEGRRLAQVRAEEQLSAKRQLAGKSGVATFAAGRTIQVVDHPRGDAELILVSVEHDYLFDRTAENPSSRYTNGFRAVTRELPYRSPRVTKKPRISGVVTGIVEADPSDGKFAKVDSEGRYTVQFLFDTTGPDGQHASRPIRMAQPHTGAGYGFHFPLRGGAEVLVTFIDGDPDRPIISAAVPNPVTASPVADANKERNVVRTGGGNEINFDDTEGAERIKLSSPRRSSTIQLGAPNAPEDGVAISTMTNVSAVSGVSANLLSTANTTLTAYASTAGNHNVNVAGKTPWFAWLQFGAAFVDGTLGATQAAIGIVQGAFNTRFLNAQKKRRDKEDAKNQARDALKNAIAAIPDCCFASGSTAKADLTASLVACEAANDQVETDALALNAAKATQLAPMSATPPVAQSTADDAVRAAQATLGKPDQDAFDPLKTQTAIAGDPSTLSDYQRRFNAKLDVQAKYATLTNACSQTDSSTCTGCSAGLANLRKALADWQSASNDLDDARSDELAEDPAVNSNYVNSQNANNSVQGVRDMINQATGLALPLYSLYSLATNTGLQSYAALGCDLLRKDAFSQRAETARTRWEDSGKSNLLIAAPAAVAPDGYGKFSRVPWADFPEMKQVGGNPFIGFPSAEGFTESRQLIGCEQHTYVWGRETLYLAGQDNAVLSSIKQVIVTSGGKAVLHGRSEVEVAGGKFVKVTSPTLVDVASAKVVDIGVAIDDYGTSQSRLKFDGQNATMTAKKVITIKTSDDQSFVVSETDKKVSMKATEIEVTATSKITLTVGSTKITIDSSGVKVEASTTTISGVVDVQKGDVRIEKNLLVQKDVMCDGNVTSEGQMSGANALQAG